MESVTINMRITASDKALLTEAAAIKGQSLSAFIRDCAADAARRVFPHAVKPLVRNEE